jgi:hypothetical protein
MNYVRAALLVLALWIGSPRSATAQRHASFDRWPGPTFHVPGPGRLGPLVADSVRQRVGYQHWKGAAIGAGVGALLGTALAFGLRGECDDCTVTTWDRTQGALLITGASSIFGFLVGLASPKYVWKQQ